MFYKKAIAFSVAAALILTSGCSFSNKDEEIVVPQGESVSNGDITVINGENMDEPPTEEEKITINIGLYEGASALGAAHLLDNSDKDVSYEYYSGTAYSSISELTAALENGDVQAAAMPLNEAAKIYNNNGGGYKIAMINSLFNYCIAQNGNALSNDIAELAGKTVVVAADDSIGKIVIDKLISDYSIEGCSVTTVDSSEALMSGLADGSIQYGLTQEPYMSTLSANNANVTMGIDLYDSWFDAGNVDIVTGCLVASDTFITTNAKAFVYFLKDYEASVILAKKNLDETAQLSEKYGLIDSADSAKAGIPGCGIMAKKNNDMANLASEFFNFVASVDVSAIGGKTPGVDFYYKE